MPPPSDAVPALRVLILSAYHTASHRSWAEGLAHQLRASGDHVALRHLPPRYFSWRIRSNPLAFALEDDLLEHPWDMIVATSMVDLATLRGIAPALAHIPALTCFHENQLAYPRRPDTPLRPELYIRDLYVALASDHIVFNSHYNRTSFLEHARSFLRSMPDHAHVDEVIRTIDARSEVLAVPLDRELFAPDQRTAGEGSTPAPLHLVWNHRWEWDKGPERFFRALELARDAGANFRLSVVGKSFRNAPPCFAEARVTFSDRIVHWGWQPDRTAYLGVLDEADVAASTALHEFQGLAILEACARGCTPLVPDRLAYPEFLGAEYQYRGCAEEPEADARAMADTLVRWCQRGAPSAPKVEPLSWRALGPRWTELVHSLAGSGRRTLRS